MKKLFFLAIALTLVSCGAPPPDASAFLHIEGQNIVDGQGRKILLRSVGLGNWLLPEGYMWKFGKNGDRPRKIENLVTQMIGEKKAHDFWRRFRQDYITEADIARIKELGFNSVRPAMNWRVFMDEQTGAFKEDGFQLIDNLVDWCTTNNVYIILDLHGAPGGQTGANIDDSENNFPKLYSDDIAQQRFIALWVEFARRYKNEPTIIAYDLLNEPLPKKFKQFNEKLQPLFKRATEAIRQVDSRHMISLEGANWSTNFMVFGPPFDDNTFYQFHKYWSTPDANSLQPFLDYRAQHNVPLWVGESGENTLDWYWAAYQLYEDQNIGWLFWPWKKMDARNAPYSIKKPDGWDKIAAFSRGGDKPEPAEAEIILNTFLENIKLAHCEYYPDVVNSIFRRLPAKIQAENFGHRGAEQSYHLNKKNSNALYYRTHEPVPIVQLEKNHAKNWRRNTARYAVELQGGEWLNYEINSPIDQVLLMLLKVKALTADPAVHIEIDGNPIALSSNYKVDAFFYNRSTPTTISKGRHDLRLVVDSGRVVVDWMQWK